MIRRFLNSIASSSVLIVSAASCDPRQSEEIRARTERDYQMVVRKLVDVAIEAMGDRDASSFEIYGFYISGEGLYSSEHLPKRIDDGVHFEIARRDLMQHRRE